jgi:branched-chain amino acid transport system permease protein
MAAVLLTLAPELLRPVKDYRMVIYSLMLIVLMITRPGGLMGSREIGWPRFLRRAKAEHA